MAWTATLKDLSKGVGNYGYVIVYIDDKGAEIAKQYYATILTDDTIIQTARNEVTAFQAVADSFLKVSLKPGDVIPLDVVAVVGAIA